MSPTRLLGPATVLAGHSLIATFSGAGQLGGGYAFTYRGTYR